MEEKTRKARLPFYITYVISMLPVILMGAWLFKRKTWGEISLPVIFIGFLGTCPLLVGGALQTIYDGNIGVLLTTFMRVGFSNYSPFEITLLTHCHTFRMRFLIGDGKE